MLLGSKAAGIGESQTLSLSSAFVPKAIRSSRRRSPSGLISSSPPKRSVVMKLFRKLVSVGIKASGGPVACPSVGACSPDVRPANIKSTVGVS